MASNQVFPKLIVFDLDCTLWPFHVDTHFDPPFKLNDKGTVIDSHGGKVPYFPEVPSVLEKLKSMNIDMAVASRTSEINGAYQLIDLFGWKKYFKYTEIYPGCKITHFEQFKKNSGINFKNMLFFDDEFRNIRDISGIGATCIFVKNGVTMKVIDEGFDKFSNNQ